MMSAKNTEFLVQITSLANKFYSFNFSPVKINVLHVKDKTFKRAYTTLTKKQTSRFLELIPLRNKKYERKTENSKLATIIMGPRGIEPRISCV